MFPVISQAANALSSLGKSFGDNARRVSGFEGGSQTVESATDSAAPGWQSALQGGQTSIQTQARPADPAQAIANLQSDQHAIESNVRMIRSANEMIGTLLDIVV